MTARIEKSRARTGGANVFGRSQHLSLVSDRLRVGLGSQLHFYKRVNGSQKWQFVVAQTTGGPDSIWINPHKKTKGFSLSWGDFTDPNRRNFDRGDKLKIERRHVTPEGKIKKTRQYVTGT